MYLQEKWCEIVDLIQLVQNKLKLQALVNTVMKIQIL
jgi:hypothetical protein